MLNAGTAARGQVIFFHSVTTLLRYFGASLLVLLAVALPAQAAAVGSTAGEFSVSDSGTARYRIPLTLPPGTAGMTPSLSLVYNSRAGDGIAGWGWGISGLSAIHRCGATYAQNDYKSAIINSDADRLCLDGNQLMLVSGTYLVNGAVYQTERETFTRIKQIGSGTGLYFKVESKNGRIRYYGSTSDARPLTDEGSAVREWRISRIEDRADNKNAILFSYSRDPGGAILPDEISYTKTAGAAAYNTISFTYAARPVAEIMPAYAAGSAVGRTKRLTTITVTHGTTIARQYNLTYESSLSPVSQHSRLASVQECGQGGTACFPATQFEWINDTATITTQFDGFGLYKAARVADINGDGRDDYFYWGGIFNPDNDPLDPYDSYLYTSLAYALTGADGNPGSGGNTTIAWDQQAAGSATALDFDGDGDDEIIFRPQSGDLTVADWNGNGFDLINLQGVSYGRAADVNGDGYDDLLQAAPKRVTVYLNRRTGDSQAFNTTAQVVFNFPDVTDFTEVVLFPKGSGTQSPILEQNQFAGQADFNGDGRSDMLARATKQYESCTPTCKTLYQTYWFVAYSRVQKIAGDFQELELGLSSETGNYKLLTPLDINGDGLTDLAYYDTTVSHWWTRLSTGTGFAAPVSAGGGFYEDENFRVTVADGNYDGRQDLFIAVPIDSNDPQSPEPDYIWQVKYSTGATLAAAVAHTLVYDDELTYKIPPALLSVDLNGDGVRAILLHTTLNRRGDAADGFAPPADQLKNITDSFGNTTTINYRPLADSAIHSATPQSAITDAYAWHPRRFVVSDYSAPDGAGSTFTVDYHYTGGARDHYGRGFLGFAEREVTDLRTGATVTTTYHQDYPYTGLPKQKDLRAADGSLISRTTIAPAQKTWGSGFEQRVLAYPQTTVETSYRLDNGQLLKTVTSQIANLDPYGNPGTRTVTALGDGQTFTTTKTQTYLNNASTWCLGQVTHSTVTQQLPNAASVTRESSAQIDATYCRPTQQKRIAVDPLYGDLSLTTDYGYDAWGNVTSTTVSGAGVTPRTSTSDYTYYQGRFPRTATNAAGHQSTFTWDQTLGLQTQVTDPNGLLATTSYDAFGRPATQTAPDGSVTIFTYSWHGLDGCGVTYGEYLLAQTHSSGARGVTVFDAFGRERMTGAPLLNGAWSYRFTRYDALGRVARQSQPFLTGGELGGCSALPEPPSFAPSLGDDDTKSPDDRYWTLYDYDLLGRAITVQHPYNPDTFAGGGQTTTAYNGFVTTVTDPNGHASTKTVNALGQTVQMKDALGQITQYVYDAAGNLITTTDPVGHVISMAYDLVGNKRVMDDPDMGHWAYTYNAYGELIAQTDAKNQTTTLDYDALGRLISRTDGAGGANEVTSTWVYDSAAHGIGQLASVTQSDGYAEQYSYDTLSRVTDVMTTVGDTDYTVSTSYDAFSRVETVTYPQSVATDNSPVNAIATALPGLEVTIGTAVTLDGSQSHDDDAAFQTLNYQWSQTAGPAVTLSGAASVQAGFTPTQAGSYTFTLTVSDGVDTATDTLNITVQPPIPGSLTISDGTTSTDGAYTLNWTAPVGGLPAGAVYRLEEDSDSQFGSPTPLIPDSPTSKSVSGKANGYWNYRVQACVGGQCSEWRSATIQVELPPGAPGTPLFNPAQSYSGDYIVYWDLSATADLLDYTLYESADGGASWTPVGTASGARSSVPGANNQLSQAIYDQPDEHTYTYRVEACIGASCTGSGTSSVRIVSQPGVPASLSVPSSTTTGSVTLNWGAASGVVSSYQLHESTSSSFTSLTHTWTNSDPGDRNRTVTVNGNDTFYYRVRACHVYDGASQCGGWREGNQGVRNYEAPGAPAGLSASYTPNGVYGGTATVTWGAASGELTRYELYEAYRSSVYHSWGAWNRVSNSSARNWSDAKYPPGIFKYRVRACNGTVCGGYASSADIIYVYEPDGGGLHCPPKCYPGAMAKPQDKPDAPQLAAVETAGGSAESASSAPLPLRVTAASSSAPFAKGATARDGGNAGFAGAKTGRRATPGGGLPSSARAQHVAYTPRAQSAQGFRLMPATRRLTPSPRVGEGWGAGGIATDQPTAFTPVYARAFGSTPFAPRAAQRAASRGNGSFFSAKGAFWQSLFEKDSGDGPGYRFTVEYQYDAYGHLTQVRNAQEQSLIYWQASASDAYGHITQASFGNGVATSRIFDPATGRLRAITTQGTAGSIQNLAYQWDAIGNLDQRHDITRGLTETFGYDAVNRLTQTEVGSLVTNLAYDALGNIEQKTVAGTATAYVYDLAGQAGPHAVTALKDAGGVITASYSYDANGNLSSGGGRTLTWNATNYPITITQGTHTTAFAYGPARQRVQQTEYQSGTLVQTTVSIGALFEQITDSSGNIRYQHYIRAGSQTIAIHTRTSAYTQETTYLHRDHLGSVSAITNEDGDVIASMSFDAWGQRRNPDTWQGSATNPAPDTTARGYTGHKMLDGVGLIHMNGRVYDPGIGRFVSADPIIQAPLNAQSYNRYSYVWNNPLSAFDPSGFLRDRPGVKTLGGGMQNLMLGGGSYDSRWVDWKDTFGLQVTIYLSNGMSISVALSDLPKAMQYSIVNSGYHVSSDVANQIADSYFSNNYSLSTLTNAAQWIFPEGQSTDMNDYFKAMTNGILGDLADFTKLVNRYGFPGFFNPSHGPIADIAESFMQKFFGGPGDSLAAAFAAGFAGVDHSMTIIAHSQGTLTVANAALYFGLPEGSTFVFKSPALSFSGAQAAAQFNGGTLQYIQPWGDAANIWSGTLNPLRVVSGAADILCGFCIHSANGLP